jgi:hypothetical protein
MRIDEGSESEAPERVNNIDTFRTAVSGRGKNLDGKGRRYATERYDAA